MFFLSATYHSKAEKYSQSDIISYNLWNDYYKIGSYEQSLNQYKKILTNTSLEFKVLHNIWNLFYRMWEKHVEQRKLLWWHSLSYYEQALFVNEDSLTRKNYEFVESKLNRLENNILDTQKDDKKDDKKDYDREGKELNRGSDDKINSNDSRDSMQPWILKPERGDKYKIWESFELSNMDNEERKTLKDYEKYLKAVELNNQNLFNKHSITESKSDNLSNDFLWDPFFDTIFDIWWEKDW